MNYPKQKMNKIQILPENLTNKIAAGEVVDRPASVVKELVENSIDAGAEDLTVIIKEGGKALIQVVDNGAGMEKSDLLLAFQRHATSKIFSYDDLINIQTLGFRGEALASIASVSRVEAKSVLQNQASGQSIRIEGGVVEGIEESAGSPGTTISVKHLFYNTPARRKFLRKTNTEYRQILSVLNRFFLAYPEISFTVVNEGEMVSELKKESFEERMLSVFGSRIQKNLIPIQNEGFLTITGFIGNQDTFRSSRGDQYLFFNKRYFISKSLSYSVVSAYGDILPRGYNPVYIAFLAMDPDQADVNVHPTKMEIKFANDNLIFSTLRGAIKRSLSSTEVIANLSPFDNLNISRPTEKRGFTDPDFAALKPNQPELDNWSGHNLFTKNENDTSNQDSMPTTPLSQKKQIFERTNIWQVHNKYILSQIKNGLILIDQHVAHERILYEQALENFEKRKPSSQQLLFPQIVEQTAEDYSLLLEMIPFLERIGFVIKAFGKNTVVLEGVPTGIKISNDEKFLLDLLDEYKRGKKERIEIRDNIAKSFACHSAIRAGEPLTLEAMNSLIDQLFSTKEPYFCPHGRPVIINLTLDELDRRFRR